MLQSGFVIFVTLFKILYDYFCFKSEDENKQNSLLDFTLRDPKGMELITEYCIKEYSVENISAYQDIQEFKKLKVLEEKLKFIEEFRMKYLNGAYSEFDVTFFQFIF